MRRFVAAVAPALIAVAALAGCHARAPLMKSEPLAGWSFEGRVAVSDGKDSGSARVSWEQDGERYRVTLRAPVSGETWRLSGDEHGCALEGVRPKPVRGSDPEELLQRELGWRLPVRAMTAWVRGRRASGEAADRTADPLVLRESGWTVTFRDWFNERDPALPKRIDAENPPYQVRLSIASWSGDAR